MAVTMKRIKRSATQCECPSGKPTPAPLTSLPGMTGEYCSECYQVLKWKATQMTADEQKKTTRRAVSALTQEIMGEKPEPVTPENSISIEETEMAIKHANAVAGEFDQVLSLTPVPATHETLNMAIQKSEDAIIFTDAKATTVIVGGMEYRCWQLGSIKDANQFIASKKLAGHGDFGVIKHVPIQGGGDVVFVTMNSDKGEKPGITLREQTAPAPAPEPQKPQQPGEIQKPEPEVKEEEFQIVRVDSVFNKPDHMYVTMAKDGKPELGFIVTVASTVEKVNANLANPERVVGRTAIVSYTDTNQLGRPKNAKLVKVK